MNNEKRYYKTIGYECFGEQFEQLDVCKDCSIKNSCKKNSSLIKIVMKKKKCRIKLHTIKKENGEIIIKRTKSSNYHDKLGRPKWENFQNYVREIEEKMKKIKEDEKNV